MTEIKTLAETPVDLFFYAVVNKTRFKAPKVNGMITTEDLFALSDADLREIGAALYNKASLDDGPFAQPTNETKRAKIEMQIVQSVMEYKSAEAKRKRDGATNRAERDRLLEILKRKQEDALGALDMSELEKRIAALGVV